MKKYSWEPKLLKKNWKLGSGYLEYFLGYVWYIKNSNLRLLRNFIKNILVLVWLDSTKISWVIAKKLSKMRKIVINGQKTGQKGGSGYRRVAQTMYTNLSIHWVSVTIWARRLKWSILYILIRGIGISNVLAPIFVR